MTFKGHCIFSLSTIIVAKKIGFSTNISNAEWDIVIIGALLSCVLPDIDHPKSIISKHFKIFSFITCGILNHRGFTHSILSFFLYIWLLNQVLPSELVSYRGFHDAMIIGYASHLIADILTTTGIPLLWPYRWRFSFPILNPNTPLKETLFCLLVLIYSIIGYY
ncbi:MAG: hypothetical protein C4617_05705 [Candidatus Liberibacter europaeus]|uniref:Metal-dependent hydrolase n=1 Tax=Candidatus Liberibacter europaeus TaxID=744859 RepID=A0A2T4VWD0_9HYPH|nr:hypothetical protein [Candidatus Liberibacter europaeus]PTL86073.1 MAG: hypothetical protein C4617_05705 [Candidatus Liberibacter europaeus]